MALDIHTEVEFNSSDDTKYIFTPELDDILNVDSDGKAKTTFAPGEPAYIKVHKSANVDITDVVSIEGSISFYLNNSRSDETKHLFATRDKKDTGEFKLGIVPSVIDVSYRGRPGSVTVQSSALGEYVCRPDMSFTPFLATFSYSYPCRIYKFTPPPMSLEEDETYSIPVVFYIKVNEV